MLKYLFLFLCVTTEAVCSILLKEQFSKPFGNSFEQITKCVTKICKTSLHFRSTVILKNGNNITVEEELFFNEMIHIVSTNNIQLVIFEDLDSINDVILPKEADWMVVVYFTNCKSLFKFNFDMVHDKIKYLILVADYEEKYCNNEFLEIGKYVADYDVTFIFGNKNKETLVRAHEIITFMPQIDEVTCKETVGQFKIITTCQNGILESSIIFPNKNPTNLKKCSLNVGIGPLYPFAIIKDVSRYKTFDRLNESRIRGSDIELVKIAGKQFNANLKYYFIEKREENPIGQYDFIPYMMNSSLDICAGGFYRIYGNSVSYSGVYARQSVLWMYAADRPNKSWQNLVDKVDGLYMFIIYYISYCSILCVICKFDNHTVSIVRTLIYSWGALVGADSLPDARSLKEKIINLMYLIMCVHLSAYIGVQLYSFFTISEPPEMLETLNDVMQSGKTSFLISSLKYFVFDEKYMKFANESEECYTFYDCSHKSLIYKGMTILLQGVFIKFQAETAVDDEAKVLGTTENVLTVYYEILIRKNSAYVAKVQDITKRLFEAGIPARLYTEAIGLTVVDKAKSASDNVISNSYSCQAGCRITLEQLDGAFYLWLIGCGISFCVFLVEFVRRKERIVSTA